jgi:hypothetical protein
MARRLGRLHRDEDGVSVGELMDVARLGRGHREPAPKSSLPIEMPTKKLTGMR